MRARTDGYRLSTTTSMRSPATLAIRRSVSNLACGNLRTIQVCDALAAATAFLVTCDSAQKAFKDIEWRIAPDLPAFLSADARI